MFRQLGPLEIGFILLIVLLLFGPGRITKVAGELGKGLKAFKNGISGADEKGEDSKDDAKD